MYPEFRHDFVNFIEPQCEEYMLAIYFEKSFRG